MAPSTPRKPLSRGPRDGRPASAGRPARPLVRGVLAPLAAIAVSGVLAFLLIGNPGVQAAPGTIRIEVGFDEWTIDNPTPTVAAGPATFVVENNGVVDHELLVLRTDTAAGELPQGISGPVPELAGKLVIGKPHQHISTNDSYAVLNRPEDANTAGHIKPGESRAFEADLKPGKYVLYCNLPGHYQRGQYMELIVTEPKETV